MRHLTTDERIQITRETNEIIELLRDYQNVQNLYDMQIMFKKTHVCFNELEESSIIKKLEEEINKHNEKINGYSEL